MAETLAAYAEVIRAAKSKKYFEDFRNDGRLANDFRLGYDLMMHSLNELIAEGVVTIENNRLGLGQLSPSGWITEGLRKGDIDAWQICDTFPLSGRKFSPDQTALELLGLVGEEHVMETLRELLPAAWHEQITHISLSDDSAGYDIRTPTTTEKTVFLEVKTTSRPGEKFSFFLSRNEWSVAKNNPNWFLVLVKKIDGRLTIFGHLDSRSITEYFPDDRHPDFQWTVAKGALFRDDIYLGLPGF